MLVFSWTCHPVRQWLANDRIPGFWVSSALMPGLWHWKALPAALQADCPRAGHHMPFPSRLEDVMAFTSLLHLLLGFETDSTPGKQLHCK